MRLAKRILARLVLLTFLGLTTSIAVAWALAAYLPNTHCTRQFSLEPVPNSGDTLRHLLWLHERPGMIRRAWHRVDTRILRLGHPESAVDPPVRPPLRWSADRVLGNTWGVMPELRRLDPQIPSYGFEDARGWPIPCLWFAASDAPGAKSTSTRPFIYGGLLLTSSAFPTAPEIYALPYLPLWKGLVIDTTLYTTLWAAPWAALTGTRLLLRRRRGLCAKCAYDLKHNLPAGCPECGWNRTVTASTHA